jgi:hypothetical protein
MREWLCWVDLLAGERGREGLHTRILSEEANSDQQNSPSQAPPNFKERNLGEG